jgi:hypothetical protein
MSFVNLLDFFGNRAIKALMMNVHSNSTNIIAVCWKVLETVCGSETCPKNCMCLGYLLQK